MAAKTWSSESVVLTVTCLPLMEKTPALTVVAVLSVARV